MMLAERDPFGFEQVIYHPSSGNYGASIRELSLRASLGAGAVDVDALTGYFTGARLSGHTILGGFRAVPPGHALIKSAAGLTTARQSKAPTPGNLEALLRACLSRIVSSGRKTAIALSGGLDSALLLAMLQAIGAHDIPAYILATDMPQYDERSAALATARQLGADVVIVQVGADDFVSALPEAMRHLEEPLYNLHPIAKLLLARAMRRDGIALAISGDGADQVLRRDDSADYLPLCRQLFQSQGVMLAPPFLDRDVVAHLTSLPPDPEKACLRTLGRQYCLAPQLVKGPKRSRLAPAMALDHLLAPERIAAHAQVLGLPYPALVTDAQRVQWSTLMLLLEDLGASA